MTRYILAGGRDRDNPDYWTELAKVVHPAPKHIVSCFFAEPDPAVWQPKFDRAKPFFEKTFPSAVVEYAKPETFAEQVKQADVIYLHGGMNKSLIDRLPSAANLRKLFEGKTVIGSSAGACALSTKCWASDGRRVEDGLALTPLNAMVHYGSHYGDDDPRGPIEWDKAEQELQEAVGDGKVTKLAEGKFVVYEV